MENYIGEIRAFPFSQTPKGWMPCEGQTLQIQQYNALYALIGIKFGGNGSTNFMLPDLRGRAMLNYGTSASSVNYPFAQAGGSETVKLTSTTCPIHIHTFVVVNTPGALAAVAVNAYLAKAPTFTTIEGDIIYCYNAPGISNVPVPLNGINITGGDAGHENRMPSLPLQLCIAIAGLWPSRS